jgi:hypothetical protein
MADKKFKGISVITAGPALGHDMMIDQTTLEQVMELGNQNSPVKVLANHSNDVGEVIGMLSNFRISGQRVRADFELLENHPQSEYFAELLTKLPDQLGFSISFSGVPRSDENGVQLADVRDLWSVDLVTRAAANKSIYEGAVDSKRAVSMNKAEPAPVAKLEAPVEAAPAAPAAPVAEPAKLAEPTMADINAKLDMILAMLAAEESDEAPEMGDKPKDEPMAAKTEETKLEAVVAEEAPAAVEPAKDEQPEPVAAEAKAEVKELSQPVPSVIAAKVIELEASRGVQPLEVSTETAFSRADLLSQFNAEKDSRRAAEIFKKLKLAR